MPSPIGMGFSPATQGSPGAPMDLTTSSHKHDSLECVAEQSKPAKKQRVVRKEPEIIQLDDVKDDVDIIKGDGH